jgi:hypothetical protein
MLSLRGLSDFVPEGLNDGSNSTELAEVQAIYCLVSMQKGNRPVGHGMIGSDGRATIRAPNQPWVRIRPCPTGRIVFAFDETSFLLHRCYQEPSPLSDTFFPFQS